MNHQSAEPAEPGWVPFRGRRLLYVVSGGIQAMFTPMWLSWIVRSYPDVRVRCVVTRGALRFTTRTAISAVGGSSGVELDEWPEDVRDPIHVEMAKWPDAVLVHPATMDFVARLALGLSGSPALLALQCTRAAISICPSVPPDGNRNAAFRSHVEALSSRDNVVVVPPQEGESVYDGERGIGVAAPLHVGLRELEDLRSWM